MSKEEAGQGLLDQMKLSGVTQEMQGIGECSPIGRDLYGVETAAVSG